jgi:hypothetical protein
MEALPEVFNCREIDRSVAIVAFECELESLDAA